jgi:hypothetical protein
MRCSGELPPTPLLPCIAGTCRLYVRAVDAERGTRAHDPAFSLDTWQHTATLRGTEFVSSVVELNACAKALGRAPNWKVWHGQDGACTVAEGGQDLPGVGHTESAGTAGHGITLLVIALGALQLGEGC